MAREDFAAWRVAYFVQTPAHVVSRSSHITERRLFSLATAADFVHV